MPQIEVTFDIDANGIVHVSAKDKASGKEQKVTIQASGGLKDDEIEAMVKDAEKNASEDKKRKEEIEIKNKADTLIYSSEKALKESGDKISDADKKAIENAIEDLKTALEEGDFDKINQKTEILAEASMKIGEAMYGSGAPDMGGMAGMNQDMDMGKKPTEDSSAKVVDGEFKDVSNEK